MTLCNGAPAYIKRKACCISLQCCAIFTSEPSSISKMKSMLVFAVLVAVAAANLLPGDEGYDEHDHDHHHHHDHEHEHHEHEHHEHEHHHHETSENAQPIAIVKSASESDPNTGKYSFSFETENGISVSENGEQKRYGDKPEEVSNVARGSYSFPHDGVTYTITWYADETGYHAEGAHLPTVPVV